MTENHTAYSSGIYELTFIRFQEEKQDLITETILENTFYRCFITAEEPLGSPVRLGSHTFVSFFILISFPLPLAKTKLPQRNTCCLQKSSKAPNTITSPQSTCEPSHRQHTLVHVNPATDNCTSEHCERSLGNPTSEWVWTQRQPTPPQREYEPSPSQPYFRACVNQATANQTSHMLSLGARTFSGNTSPSA